MKSTVNSLDISLLIYFSPWSILRLHYSYSKVYASTSCPITHPVKIANGGFYFYFLFLLFFYFLFFIFLYFSIFRTTRVRVYQSYYHTSHKLMASHKTDHETWENGVEGSGIK